MRNKSYMNECSELSIAQAKFSALIHEGFGNLAVGRTANVYSPHRCPTALAARSGLAKTLQELHTVLKGPPARLEVTMKLSKLAIAHTLMALLIFGSACG